MGIEKLNEIQANLNEATAELLALRDQRDQQSAVIADQQAQIEALKTTQLTAEQAIIIDGIAASSKVLADIVQTPVNTGEVATDTATTTDPLVAGTETSTQADTLETTDPVAVDVAVNVVDNPA